MPTHPTAVRNTIADVVVDLLDVGTGNPSIVFQTAGDVEVATNLMDGTNAFGAASAGIATANAIADSVPATGGVTTKAIITDRDDLTIIEATVGTSGTDFIVSSTTIPAAAVIVVASLTYTAPA